MLRRRLTFANVVSLLALFIAMGTGGAYAANTIGSDDIIDESILSKDIHNEGVANPDIHDHSISPDKLKDGAVTSPAVADGTLTSADLGFDSVDSGEIRTDAVHGSEVAAGAIDGDELADGGVTTADIATGTVTTADIATGAVNAAKVADDSLDAFDLAGGESNGTITLNAGFVANGRCRDFNVAVTGAQVGDAVLFSVNSAVPAGIALSGVRVSAPDNVVAKACNLSGAAFPQLTGVQVAIVTIGI
jgi:hypothetical protein